MTFSSTASVDSTATQASLLQPRHLTPLFLLVDNARRDLAALSRNSTGILLAGRFSSMPLARIGPIPAAVPLLLRRHAGYHARVPASILSKPTPIPGAGLAGCRQNDNPTGDIMLKLVRAFFGACVSCALVAATPAFAVQMQKVGKIKTVFVSGGSNLGFRITLYSTGGADQLAECAYDLAYVNAADDNYQTKVSTLLVAYAQQSSLNVTIEKQVDNTCHIIEFGTV